MERRSRIIEDVFGRMPKVLKGVGSQKMLAFSINKGVFGNLDNRFGMIVGRNKICKIQVMENRITFCWKNFHDLFREKAVFNQSLEELD